MMTVNRRLALKHLLVFSAAVVLIPSCMQDKSKSSILLQHVNINGDQEKLLDELCETIIPATDTPGAKAIGAHLFTLRMLDDCYKKEDQDKFVRGLNAFTDFSKEKSGKSFTTLTASEREKIVAMLDAGKGSDAPIDYFYRTTKRLCIRSYTTSKFFLTKVQVYELVPGRWHGCVPVSAVLKQAS